MKAIYHPFLLLLLLAFAGNSKAQGVGGGIENPHHYVPSNIDTLLARDGFTTLPFTRAGNLILLKGRVDSTEGNFVLDTGAPGLVLNITYFRDYHTTQAEERGSVTGEMQSNLQTVVNSFSFGSDTFIRQQADLISLGHIEDIRGVKILGLVGMSFFLRKELIIDYERSVIHTRPARAKDKPSRLLRDTSTFSTVAIDIIENKIVAYTTMLGRKMKFIIDTGAESNVLDSRLPNKVFEQVSINRRTQIMGANRQKVDALYGSLKNMQVGSQAIGNLPVLITNLENACISTMCCVDGMLGFDFLSLHKIGFNFAKQEMYIWK